MNSKRFLLATGVVLIALISALFINGSGTDATPNPMTSNAEEKLSSTRGGREEPDVPEGCKIKQWNSVEDFDVNLAQFETVFWDPRDTISLRKLIRQSDLVADAKVLEIGCGSGLLGLCCLKSGASQVIVTDVNQAAVANTNYNAQWLGLQAGIETRLVPLDDSGAFAVIKPDEKFDLIISNPPWVNQDPKSIDEFALYDKNFKLMRSLFDGMKERLNPGGRVWLAYGCVDAIRTMAILADDHGFDFKVLDDRNLDDLPEEFLPGMLVEVKLKGIQDRK